MAELETVILDCTDIISTLSNCYIKRTKNVVARCLVGMAQQFGSHSWVGYVPEPAALAVCFNSLSQYQYL